MQEGKRQQPPAFLRNKWQVYHLDQMAKRYGVRPASYLFSGDLSGDLIAYQFDRAVFLFGMRTEARYEERDKKGRRKRTLEEAMNSDAPSINISEWQASDEDKILALSMMLMGGT